MRIAISGKNIEITDTLRARIEKKVGKLDKYLREDPDVQVKLSQEPPNRNTAEITITLNGARLRVEETLSLRHISGRYPRAAARAGVCVRSARVQPAGRAARALCSPARAKPARPKAPARGKRGNWPSPVPGRIVPTPSVFRPPVWPDRAQTPRVHPARAFGPTARRGSGLTAARPRSAPAPVPGAAVPAAGRCAPKWFARFV